MKGYLIGGPMNGQTFVYDEGPVLDEVEIESANKKFLYLYGLEDSNIELSPSGAARVGIYYFIRQEPAKKTGRRSDGSSKGV